MIPKSEIQKNIEDKLSEANYFLSVMKFNEADLPKFRYNLSAFLCSGHFVRDIIRAQDLVWYYQQTLALSDFGLFFWELRNVSVHEKSANPPRTTCFYKSFAYAIEGQPDEQVPLCPPRSEVKGYFFPAIDEDFKNRIIKGINGIANRLDKIEKTETNPEILGGIRSIRDDIDRVSKKFEIEISRNIDETLQKKDVLTLCDEYILELNELSGNFKKKVRE